MITRNAAREKLCVRYRWDVEWRRDRWKFRAVVSTNAANTNSIAFDSCAWPFCARCDLVGGVSSLECFSSVFFSSLRFVLIHLVMFWLPTIVWSIQSLFSLNRSVWLCLCAKSRLLRRHGFAYESPRRDNNSPNESILSAEQLQWKIPQSAFGAQPMSWNRIHRVIDLNSNKYCYPITRSMRTFPASNWKFYYTIYAVVWKNHAICPIDRKKKNEENESVRETRMRHQKNSPSLNESQFHRENRNYMNAPSLRSVWMLAEVKVKGTMGMCVQKKCSNVIRA